MKATMWSLVLVVSLFLLQIPAYSAGGNWTHQVKGKTVTNWSHYRHLSLEIDSMAAGAFCTATTHEIQGLGGTMSEQWARACYKLIISNNKNLACQHYDYIGDSMTDAQIYAYVSGYCTENCDLNLLGAHRYKVAEDRLGMTGPSPDDFTIVFQYACFVGGVQRSVNGRIKTQLHENACHDCSVSPNVFFHCTNDCPCKMGDIDTITFCGTRNTGCLQRLIDFNHID